MSRVGREADLKYYRSLLKLPVPEDTQKIRNTTRYIRAAQHGPSLWTPFNFRAQSSSGREFDPTDPNAKQCYPIGFELLPIHRRLPASRDRGVI